jgi:hypothetical protein
MSAGPDPPNTPRAVVHKQVLDAAKRQPDASLEALADEVSGASVELVEKTLAEYGDPAGQPGVDEPPAADGHAADGDTLSAEDDDPAADSPGSSGASGATDAANAVDSALGDDRASGAERARRARGNGRENGDTDGAPEIPERTRETLRLVCEDPGASQADLADRMDVAKSTINKWLHALEGFEWERRREFAARHVDCDAGRGDDRTASGGGPRRGAGRASDGAVVVPAEIAPEVVYASLTSGRLTDDEALRLLESVMGGDR